MFQQLCSQILFVGENVILVLRNEVFLIRSVSILFGGLLFPLENPFSIFSAEIVKIQIRERKKEKTQVYANLITFSLVMTMRLPSQMNGESFYTSTIF